MRFPTDTHPEIAALQAELLYQATDAERFQLMQSLTRWAVTSSRQAIQDANPKFCEQDVDLKFIELNYGTELATSVRHFLASNDR